MCEDFAGAALWLPPGVGPDEAGLGSIFTATMSAERYVAVGAALGRLEDCHPPEPHWFLPIIARDFARQGRDIGGQWMKHALRHCDADGKHVYLESSNPASVMLYERHGFETVREVRIDKGRCSSRWCAPRRDPRRRPTLDPAVQSPSRTR